MYKKISFLFFLVILFTGTLQAQSKTENQVATAVENLRKAMVDGDKAILENITGENLSYGHSSGLVETKKEFVDKLTNGSSDFVTIDLSEQTIIISGKTAIVRHTFTAKTNDGGRPGNVKIKVLLVWQKLNGGWKLIARQAIRLT
jgi:ketosteroid isomerase-like protein